MSIHGLGWSSGVIQWTFLISDLLFYILLSLVLFYFFLVCRHDHLKKIWIDIFSKPLAIISFTIVALYLIIALLDSLHFLVLKNDFGFKADPYTVHSVLDISLMPLPIVNEETYAAPLSTHLYQKEWLLSPMGKVQQVFIPLNYVPKFTGSRMADIGQRFGLGVVWGLLCTMVLWGIYAIIIGKLNPLTSRARKNFFISLLIILTLGGGIWELAHAYHVMGTNKIGQDIFYIAIKSIRTGVLMGSLTTLLMLPLAIMAAIPAGYWGGWIDDTVQFIYITLSSIPAVLLIAASILAMQIYVSAHPDIFVTSTLRADVRLLTLCAILGLTSWTTLCRIIRAETLKLRESDFVLASQAMGKRSIGIMLHHILPNISHLILVTVVLDFSSLVMAEAVLTYIGVGVDPNMYSWGNMIAAARLELAREPVVWWPLISAFVLMFIFILAINLFADSVRKGFSPRER